MLCIYIFLGATFPGLLPLAPLSVNIDSRQRCQIRSHDSNGVRGIAEMRHIATCRDEHGTYGRRYIPPARAIINSALNEQLFNLKPMDLLLFGHAEKPLDRTGQQGLVLGKNRGRWERAGIGR